MTTTPIPHAAGLSAVPELLPCPFCGVVPVIERCDSTQDRLYGTRKWWGIKCRSTLNHGGTCAVYINPQASIEAAVKRWNTRAPIKAKQAADIPAGGLAEEARDAARYRWLRDVSVPPHNFYISVPIEFDGVRYGPAEVDAAIDAAMASSTPTSTERD